MNKPFFSIIVPFYNVENYIDDCIKSIQLQSFIDYEVIFVDDNSSDSSSEIVNSYISNNSNFRVISLTDNLGMGIARNLGIEKANGDYIIFIDSDDTVEPDLLSSVFNELSEHKFEADVVQFNYNIVNVNLELISKSDYKNKIHKIYNKDLQDLGSFNINTIHSNCFVDNVPNCWAKSYKRDFLLKNKITFPDTLFEDSVFSNLVLLNASKIIYIDKCLYNYRRGRPRSITSSKSKKVFDIFKNISILRHYLSNNKFSKYKCQFNNFVLYQIATAKACLPKEYLGEFRKECKKHLSVIQYLCIAYLLKDKKGTAIRFLSFSYWLYKLNKKKWKFTE